jgi:hypothetical protein
MVKKVNRKAVIPRSELDKAIRGKNKYSELNSDVLSESLKSPAERKRKIFVDIPRKKKGEFQGKEHRPVR